jgi:cytochrome P450
LLDLASPDFRRNPFPAYEIARAAAPIMRDPRTGLWMLLDYDSVRLALTDHRSFSSGMAPAGRSNPDWLIFLDPPRHGKLRSLISKAFTPRAVSDLELRIRALSKQLLDKVADSGCMDVVADYAIPLPTMVVAEMIGIPAADWALFHGWSNGILLLSQTVVAPDPKAVMAYGAVKAEMEPYLDAMIAKRRAEPRDDLLTRMVHAEVDGERLSKQEIVCFIELLIVAGQETTSNLIANSILCFAENPDQREQLAIAPQLIPSAVEEVLRYRSPVQWLFRTTLRDVTLREQTIPAGSVVIPVIGAANRDPQVFAEPNRFGIERSPNPHIAFGHGGHFCIGAPLARLEARIAIQDLFERLTNWQLAGTEPWEPRAAVHVHGPAAMKLRFKARR